MAEPLGFDKVFVVEHHFTDYAACPDNAQFLSYLAAKTSRVKLGSGAFILRGQPRSAWRRRSRCSTSCPAAAGCSASDAPSRAASTTALLSRSRRRALV